MIHVQTFRTAHGVQLTAPKGLPIAAKNGLGNMAALASYTLNYLDLIDTTILYLYMGPMLSRTGGIHRTAVKVWALVAVVCSCIMCLNYQSVTK